MTSLYELTFVGPLEMALLQVSLSVGINNRTESLKSCGVFTSSRCLGIEGLLLIVVGAEVFRSALDLSDLVCIHRVLHITARFSCG